MKKLLLHDKHIEAGANMMELLDTQIPADYGNESEEYKAARHSAAIADLSYRGKLRLSGKEHLRFLQGMLSNDVVKLEPGKGVYATLLTVKGRVVSDMSVYKSEDSVYLDLEPGMSVSVAELLKKYRLSYKAEIEDLTDSTGMVFVAGPAAGGLVSAAFDVSLDNIGEFDHVRAPFGDASVTIVKHDRTGGDGFDVIVDNALLKSLWEFLTSGDNLKPVGRSALETLRIEAGIPRYGIDVDDTTIPIEAGLWSALNFEKGCYVGQEVVARIKWRGHVNRHLMGLIMDNDKLPSRDDEVFSGEKKIGRVTSGVYSPLLKKPVALAYIRREFIEPGTPVTVILSSSDPVGATVSALPFESVPE